jgi:hypothetical protein
LPSPELLAKLASGIRFVAQRKSAQREPPSLATVFDMIGVVAGRRAVDAHVS